MPWVIPYRNTVLKPPLGTRINRSHPIAQGLVAAWLMNEGGGSTLYDISGNNYNMALTGTYSWGVGQAGSIINPSAGYASSSTGYNFTSSSDLTFAARIFYTGQPGGFPAIVHQGLYGIYFETTLGIGLVYNNAMSVMISAAAFTANTWCDIVAVCQGGTKKMYLNGYDNTSARIDSNYPDTVTYAIGRGNNYESKCEIDSVKIWNRALSISEIKQLYAQPFCFMQQQRLWLPTGAGAAPTSNTYGFAGIGGVQGAGQVGFAG